MYYKQSLVKAMQLTLDSRSSFRLSLAFSLSIYIVNNQKRLEIFDRLADAIPDPATELNYSSPFELLIAVVLSAQATDKGVTRLPPSCSRLPIPRKRYWL